MNKMAENVQRGGAGIAQSVTKNPKDSLMKQANRVHAFLNTVKMNRIALEANATDRLHQGLENIDLFETTVSDFENRLNASDPNQAEQLELEWAHKVKSMCDSGLDAVIATMKKATATATKKE